MLPCVYCTSEEFEPGKGSEEHAILSALGGRKSSRNICCVTCNNMYGREIDVFLSEAFHFFCTMIGVKTGRGQDAPIHERILTIGNETYDLLPGGKNRLSANKVTFADGEDASKVSIMARDEATALRLMNQALGKYGKDVQDLATLTGTSVTHYPDPMQVELSIGQECYRSIAKMALTYAATLMDAQRLRGEAFAKIKSFIKGENTINDQVRIEAASVFPDAPKIDDVNHRLFFFASAEKKQAVVLVELFGHFRFSVVLTDAWTGISVAKAHVINPVTHERTDMDLPFSDLIFQTVQKQSDAQQIDAITRAISTVGAVINKRQQGVLISQMVGKAFNYQENEPDRMLSEEELLKALESIAADLARFITRSSFAERIDLTGLLRSSIPSSQNES